MSYTDQLRDLTYDERATWGTCPVCGAPEGEWCYPEIGLPVGVRPDGSRLPHRVGVHLGRLQRAPKRVRLVPA